MDKSQKIPVFLNRFVEKHNLIIAIALILLISAFYLSTLKEGHLWMDDCSMYIMQAANIAEGRTYADTCYLYNPANPYVGPKSYSPLYPLLLSPIYKNFGLNFKAMKRQNVIFFSFFLFAVFLFFKNRLNSFYALSAVAILGFNPRFWGFKELIYADFLFCFLVYLFFLIYKRAFENNKLFKPALCGFLAWGAYAARMPGLLIPFSVIAYEILAKRINWRSLSVFTAAFSVLFILQSVYLGFSGSYMDQIAGVFKNQPEKVIHILGLFLKSFRDFFYFAGKEIPVMNAAVFIILILMFGLSVFAFYKSREKAFSALGVFVFTYVALIGFMGIYDGIRYIFPIVPAFLLYAFLGMDDLPGAKIKKYLKITLVFGILTLYSVEYLKYADFSGNIRSNITSKETMRTFDFLRKNTKNKDVLISGHPRTFCLFTGRKTSVYMPGGGDKRMLDYFNRVDARYAIVGREFRADMLVFYPFIRRQKDKFKEIYSNKDFKIFKFLPNFDD